MSNMPAEPLPDERHILYRLALAVDGECVLRYDNEAGKGDHRHVRDKEHEYRFKNAEQLFLEGRRGNAEMKTVTLSVADRQAAKRRALDAFSGKRRGAQQYAQRRAEPGGM